MKLFSMFLVACGVLSATAFTPSAFGVSKTSSRPSTAAFFSPDPDFLSHLASHAQDAVKLIILECDNQDCAKAHAWREVDGWHFSGGLDGDMRSTTKKILMMQMEDCE